MATLKHVGLIPDGGRRWARLHEMALREAYQVSIALDHWTWGHQAPNFPEWVSDSFSSPVYWWMWPFRTHTERHFKDWAQAVKDGTWEKLVTSDGTYYAYLKACKKLAAEYKER